MSMSVQHRVSDHDRVSRAVNEARIWSRLTELGGCSSTPNRGVTRLALTQEDIEARKLVVGWAEALGAELYLDDATNLFIRYPGLNPSLPPVVTGSHIDTVPEGGKYDGAYGVIAALEVLEAMHEANIRPNHSVEAVIWTNEEGARFAPGQMGSAAFSKSRSLDEIRSIKDRSGISVQEELTKVLHAIPGLRRRELGIPLRAFFEAHIEQGPELEAEQIKIGVVTGIQGRRSFLVTIVGEAAHGGTAIQTERKDALLTAVKIISAIEAHVLKSSDARLTIGRVSVQPNAPLVVPAVVEFSVDVRHPLNNEMQRLGDAIPEICRQLQGVCTAQVEENANAPSINFEEGILQVVEDAATRLKLSHKRMLSLAGHDARELAKVTSTGMIFVPCKKGVSHSAKEDVLSEDLAAGARVLAGAVLTYASHA